MAGIQCVAPFEGYIGYRVYHKDKDRYYYHMTYKGPDPLLKGKKRTVSIARYLMSVHLGKEVEKGLEVDHRNGIATDDRLENLQILTGPENLAKLHEQNQYDFRVEIPCAFCETKVKAKRSRIARSDRVFCSRKCNSSFYGNLRREQSKQALDSDRQQA